MGVGRGGTTLWLLAAGPRAAARRERDCFDGLLPRRNVSGPPGPCRQPPGGGSVPPVWQRSARGGVLFRLQGEAPPTTVRHHHGLFPILLSSPMQMRCPGVPCRRSVVHPRPGRRPLRRARAAAARTRGARYVGGVRSAVAGVAGCEGGCARSHAAPAREQLRPRGLPGWPLGSGRGAAPTPNRRGSPLPPPRLVRGPPPAACSGSCPYASPGAQCVCSHKPGVSTRARLLSCLSGSRHRHHLGIAAAGAFGAIRSLASLSTSWYLESALGGARSPQARVAPSRWMAMAGAAAAATHRPAPLGPALLLPSSKGPHHPSPHSSPCRGTTAAPSPTDNVPLCLPLSLPTLVPPCHATTAVSLTAGHAHRRNVAPSSPAASGHRRLP